MSANMDNRIGDLMRERGLKPFPFSKEIGVKSSTMTSIYKGKVNFENIRIDTFIRIAHGLGMTADELFYGERSDQLQIDSAEQHIVDCYRSTDARGKAAITRTAEGEAGVEGQSEGNRRAM